ncbi:MAG: hypothetical protein JWQ18_2189, partial [Conexibacter sp.]|nr:hypothetical protein [Conexibacter sp.]
MDAATTRMAQLGLPVIDDRRAILAEPPGRRDLGAAE